MMKEKTKKVKRTPEQKAIAIATLAKKFSESEAGRSIDRIMQYSVR